MRLVLTILTTESTQESHISCIILYQENPLEYLMFVFVVVFFLQKILKTRTNLKSHLMCIVTLGKRTRWKKMTLLQTWKCLSWRNAENI